MIGVNVNSLPYQQKITYPMIPYVRLCRNLTQAKFGEVCKVDQGVLAKLERGDLQLSPHYETKIMDGVSVLNISEHELDAIKKLLVIKEKNNRGL
ncbi:helix-turn-helix transcriptional regulator [Peribacillus frigoritolerans]|uniref:helix-turn-helix domain-containing protein n=1 Tax=Peribacillus frigoritolerans TaxID=450367 RepID=UPI001EFE27E6|nr:helix-turn-helix transcriptional regulator [Peribacillus frigoritolerans]ULM97927.1 helix-turn-helix transcriptional regulator [Peribacillus frigoritolerans]